jgi:hypothetical protein
MPFMIGNSCKRVCPAGGAPARKCHRHTAHNVRTEDGGPDGATRSERHVCPRVVGCTVRSPPLGPEWLRPRVPADPGGAHVARPAASTAVVPFDSSFRGPAAAQDRSCRQRGPGGQDLCERTPTPAGSAGWLDHRPTAVGSASRPSVIRSDQLFGDAWQSTQRESDLVEHHPTDPAHWDSLMAMTLARYGAPVGHQIRWVVHRHADRSGRSDGYPLALAGASIPAVGTAKVCP